jgi:uncharacterized OB-fold protein
MSETSRLLPDVEDPMFRGYWEHCREEMLTVVACLHCGTLRWPPREICAHCYSYEWQWREVAGEGTVFSWTVVNRATSPGFDVPYAVVMVDLDVPEPGIRMLGNLLDYPNNVDTLVIGARVQVAFEVVSEEVTLPQWRLIGRKADPQ